MILKDNSDPKGRTVEIKAVEGANFFEVRAEGFGEKEAEDGHGSILAIEMCEGRLVLHVFSDIRQEVQPT